MTATPPRTSATPQSVGSAETAAAPPSPSGQALREIRKGVVAMWWGFFDWIAVVSWKKLLLVWLLALILGGILQHPVPVILLALASFIVKTVAGGKRRAEIAANEAVKRAERRFAKARDPRWASRSTCAARTSRSWRCAWKRGWSRSCAFRKD